MEWIHYCGVDDDVDAASEQDVEEEMRLDDLRVLC